MRNSLYAESRSERIYRRLLRFYPEQFRAEFGQQMVQSFRDRWREKVGQAGFIPKVGFWVQILSDFAATAPLEHLKKEAFMDSAERNLRWDVRYGVQMFLRHSAMTLKYTAWVGVSLLGLWIAAILAVWIVSIILVGRMEQPLNDAWRKTTGQTSQDFYQTMLVRHPASQKNRAAIELEGLATRLGVVNPGPDTISSQVRGNRGPFGQYDAPAYLDLQLEEPADEIGTPPPEIRDYLVAHQSDLETLYDRVLQNEPATWDIDIRRGFKAPVPNLLFHRQLHGVIALDILQKTSQGKEQPALKAFEASWRISESLRQRPELISQFISLQVLTRQAGVLRKMKSVPAEWQDRIMNTHLLEHFSEALQLDATVVAQGITDSSFRIHVGGWADLFLNSPGSGPLRRLIGLQGLQTTVHLLSELKAKGYCNFDPEVFRSGIEASHSFWNPGEELPSINYPEAYRDPLRLLIHLELTQKVVQAKSELAELKRGLKSTKEIPIKSAICSDAIWVCQFSPQGSILIFARQMPKWITEEQQYLRPHLSSRYYL